MVIILITSVFDPVFVVFFLCAFSTSVRVGSMGFSCCVGDSQKSFRAHSLLACQLPSLEQEDKEI